MGGSRGRAGRRRRRERVHDQYLEHAGRQRQFGCLRLSACAVTKVANQVVPSVVTIAAHGAGGSGTGSGELIRSDGYILTNNHVISIAASGGQ